MQNEDFQHWLGQSADLTINQKKRAFTELSDKAHQELSEEQLGEVNLCPHWLLPNILTGVNQMTCLGIDVKPV